MKIKRNYLIFFYIYFCAQLIFIYINTFLPIYFLYITDVNRAELAFIQIFAYSTLFIKPIIAIYFDKKKAKIKLLIITCSFGVLISYVMLIINLKFLIIFGFFLGLNLAFMSIIDVAIDKIIIESSLDDKTKNKNAAYTQLGAIIGAIFPNLISFIIFNNIHNIDTWDLFFFIGLLSIFPIIFMGILLKQSENNFDFITKINDNDKKINLKSILLLSIILFLTYGERIFEYPLEPWIINKYGEEYLSLFLLFLIILILLNALGVIIASIISSRLNRKKTLIISSFIYGILLVIVPFTDIFTFFILFGIMQIFSGFIIVNIISLMMKESCNNVVYYQIMVAFIILSIVIFVPIGTFLSGFIDTEILIIIAGILKLISIIPMLFIKNHRDSISDSYQ